MNKTLSVIIPVYNGQKFIERCHASITHHDEIEIVMVDDGSSKKESARLIDTLALSHSNVLVIHKSNAGVQCARNTGLLICDGNFVEFLDQDDIWIDEPLTRDVVLQLKKQEKDILRFGFQMLGEDCSTQEILVPPEYHFGLHHGAVDTLFFHHSSYLFRRRFLLENGLRYPENCGDVGDLAFTQMAAFLAEGYETFEQSLFGWVENRGSVSRTQDRLVYDQNIYNDFLCLEAFYQKHRLKSDGTVNAQCVMLFLRSVRNYTRICKNYDKWYEEFIEKGLLQKGKSGYEKGVVHLPGNIYEEIVQLLKNEKKYYWKNRLKLLAEDYGSIFLRYYRRTMKIGTVK